MPRKKKTATTTDATQPADGTAPADGGSDKVQAVKDALAGGIESPTEIVKLLKDQGIEITPNYVSLIKGKVKGAGGRKKGKGGRPRKAPPAPAAAVPAAAQVKRAAPAAPGLAPQDLIDLAGLADKAGGFKQLRAYLDVIEKLR